MLEANRDFLYYFKFNPWSSSPSIFTSQLVMRIIISHSRQSATSVSYWDPTNPKDKFSCEDKCSVSVRLSGPAEWWLVGCVGMQFRNVRCNWCLKREYGKKILKPYGMCQLYCCRFLYIFATESSCMQLAKLTDSEIIILEILVRQRVK